MADKVASFLCKKIDPSGHLVCGALYEPCFCCHSFIVSEIWCFHNSENEVRHLLGYDTAQSRGGYRRTGEPVASKFQQTDQTFYEGLLNNSATKIQIRL